MKFTNEYYKKNKSERLFYNYQEIRKKIRQYTQKIIPLTPMEKILYSDNIRNIETSKVKEGKYFEYNGIIYLLNIVPKTKVKELFSGIQNMVIRNSSNKIIGRQMFENDINDMIKIFNKNSNHHNMSRYYLIEPQDRKLIGIVKLIDITIFEFSNDYIGIASKIELNENIKKEINQIMNGDCKGEIEYVKSVGKHKYVSKFEWNPNITRTKIVNEYITEIKCRSNEFIKKYIPINNYRFKEPISLDILETNYDLEQDKYDSIFEDYEIYKYGEISKIDAKCRKSRKSDEDIKVNFLFKCAESIDDVTRSSKMLLQKEDESSELLFDVHNLINFFCIVLYFYLLGDFERILTNIRKQLHTQYLKNKKSIYSDYEKTIDNVQEFKMIFNNIYIDKKFYSYDYITESISFLNKRYDNLIKDYEKIDLSFNNKMLVNNYKSSMFLGKASIALSVAAILLTIVLQYKQDADKTIEIEIKKQSESINYIKHNIEDISQTIKKITKDLDKNKNN